MPTTIPVTPSIIRIGNRIWESVTVRCCGTSDPTNSGMRYGAITTKNAVMPVSTRPTRKMRVEASRNASLNSRFWRCSVNTGTNAAWIAASANRLRTRFGTWKAIVNADIAPLTPK